MSVESSVTTSARTRVHSPASALPHAERSPARDPADDSAATPRLAAVGLATVLVGVLLPMVDFFIVNVALPTMARDLHASAAMLELVVSAYAMAYALLLVIGGRLGDAHGRRRLFLTGMAAFTVTSLLCGIAPTAPLLVAARAAQGAAAALMVPQTLSTIQATGDPGYRARALGWYGATGGIAAVAGQVLGGLLVSANIAGAGWRPIFLVNVPIGLAGLILAARRLPETRAPRAARIDITGTALLGATLVALLIPLTEGRTLGWPLWSWLLLGLSPFAAAGFVAVERRSEAAGRTPLVPPSLLAHASMRRGLGIAVPFFAGFGAFMFVYALLVQDVLRFDALTAGVALAPMAAAFLVASLQTARLVARFGRRVIGAGGLLQLAGLLALGGTLAAAWPDVRPLALAPAFVVMGLGQGLVMSPLVRVVLSEVPVASAGAGSGVLTTAQQLSLAIGVATFGTLFISLMPVTRLGPLGATGVVIAAQAVAAVGIAVGSRRLPQAARG